tara:strand:+ start:185 stop:724 length:540 start_codon:yes stop_codon:yes gene_type:complete
LPEYNIKTKPDYLKLGQKVDEVLESDFLDGTYIVRAISSDDHKDLLLHELMNIIERTGTDKYDANRKGVCHDEFLGYDYDIQAGTIEIKNRRIMMPKSYTYPTVFGDTIWHFYEHALIDRGYSVRIDLLLFYDSNQLRRARKKYPEALGVRKGLDQYLYKFKDPKNKKDALIGIVKISR